MTGRLLQALRQLRRAPWYAATAVVVLAVALALETAVFAIVDGVLFKPLPYQDSTRLFALSMGYSKLAEPYRLFPWISEADFLDLRAAVSGATITAFFGSGNFATIGVRESVRSGVVDAAFFDVIGVRPAVGGFSPEDFQSAGPIRPAIITDGLWRRRFGTSPNIVGQTFVGDDGRGVRIVGVLPADFVFPQQNGREFAPDLLTPWATSGTPSRGAGLCVLVRVPATTSDAEVSAQLAAALARQAAARPAPTLAPGVSERRRILAGGYDRIALVPIREALTDGLREYAWAVLAAASALVLLACLNIVGLTVARVRDRWRDLVVRRALGARTIDLLGVLAVEHAVVVALGAGLGLLTARAIVTTVEPLIVSFLVVIKPPAIDARIAVFEVFAAGACVALVTLMSARATARASLRAAISDGGGTTTRDRGAMPIVSIELGVGLVLAVGGALVAGSLLRVWQEDPGFDPSNAVVISMSAPAGASAAAIEDLVTDIGRMPGVVHAGSIGHTFLERAAQGNEFDRPPGVPPSDAGPGQATESVPVTHGFFDAAGITAIRGRMPTDAELSIGAPLVVVTEKVATEYWPGHAAVGQSLVRKGRSYEVIGVVRDARIMSLDMQAQGEIFWPTAASERPTLGHVLLRFADARAVASAPVAAYVTQRCPACWFYSAERLSDALGATVRPRQFSAWLFSSFGLAALVIVGAGVLGVVAMTTKRRTREIGIRMALGATRGHVTRQIVGEQLMPVAVGLAAGGAVAAWATRFVQAYLYKTPTYDPWAWSVAVAGLLTIALVGALVPSRRASRVDPVRALRVD